MVVFISKSTKQKLKAFIQKILEVVRLKKAIDPATKAKEVAEKPAQVISKDAAIRYSKVAHGFVKKAPSAQTLRGQDLMNQYLKRQGF